MNFICDTTHGQFDSGEDRFGLGGRLRCEIHRKDGSVEQVPWSKNLITNEGFMHLLNVVFGSTAKVAAWYGALISNVSFSALVAADTMASHSGWNESVAYTATVRQTIAFVNTTSGVKNIGNTTTADYAINADNTVIKGVAIVADNVKSGSTGPLWAEGLFSADQTLYNGDILKFLYQINVN